MSYKVIVCNAGKAIIPLLICLVVGLPVSIGVSAAAALETPKIPSPLPAGKLKKRNPALAIPNESVLQKIKEKQAIVIVDIRSRKKFEQFSIPGSINIPLFAIKTKTFLKSKSLILVDEGYHCSKLERECEILKKLGFKVWYLNGGLWFWSRKGAPLKGDIFARKDFDKNAPIYPGESVFVDITVAGIVTHVGAAVKV